MKKLLSIIICLLILIGLFGCNEIKAPISPSDKDWHIDGYTKGSVTATDMYDDIIAGVINSLKEVNKNNVSTANPYASLYLRFGAVINNKKYQLIVKSNHNFRTPNNDSINIELIDNKEAIVLSIVVYEEDTKARAYISFGENKLMIPIAVPNGINLIPIDIKASMSTTLKLFFNSVVKIQSDAINYEYKDISGAYSRHYNFKLDVAETLKKFIVLAKTPNFTESYLDISINQIDDILQAIFGYSIKDIEEGKMATSHTTMDVITNGGSKSIFGMGKMNTFSAKFDFPKQDGAKNIFGGNPVKGEVHLESIFANNSLISSIPKESSLTNFVAYDKNAFEFTSQLKYGDELFDFKTQFLYDTLDQSNTKVKIEIEKGTTKMMSAYYKDNKIYINYVAKNGSTKHIQFHFDLTNLVDDMDSNISGMPFLNIFINMLKSINVKDGLGINIDNNFLKLIIGKNINEIVGLLDSYSSDNLEEMLLSMDIDIDSIFQNKPQLVISPSKQFWKVLSTIELPADLTQL